MSRSRRHTPIAGYTTRQSEKQDKRLAARAFRRLTRIRLVAGKEPPVDPNETSDPWTWAKDGKAWLPLRFRDKGMRK